MIFRTIVFRKNGFRAPRPLVSRIKIALEILFLCAMPISFYLAPLNVFNGRYFNWLIKI